MQHYITEIKIDEVRHLSDIVISLNPKKRQHLIITGKNGSGKTSLLLAIQKYLQSINDGKLTQLLNRYMSWLSDAEKKLKEAKTEVEKYEAKQAFERESSFVRRYKEGIDILFSNVEEIDALYSQGDFIIAFFPADRKTQIIRGHGVEEITLKDCYDIHADSGKYLHKYMIHLKTQQSYARNEGDMANVDRIQKWFDRFVEALKVLLDDDTISLEYRYREYDFKIHQEGKKPFGFDELSDGYSSVIHIVSDLILRMDKNWLLSDSLSHYDIEGIVLIDELETHLHIELQKKIMPFLTKFFPRIQFIVTTHSPYILNSITDAKAYDLERCVELENLFAYSADDLAEGYFSADEYSDELKSKIERYKYLLEIKEPTEDERAERAKIRSELKNIPRGLSSEARDQFEGIEGQRL